MKSIGALLVAVIALVSASGCARKAAETFDLTLVDMQGQRKVLGQVLASAFAPRVSPDGSSVAFEQADAATADSPEMTRIYVARLDDLEDRRGLPATTTSRRHVAPVWSPDGKWIAFVSNRNGADALFYQASDGSRAPEYLMDGRAFEGWYGDDNLAFITLKGESDYGISMVNLQSKQVTVLIDLPDSEQHSSRISPDGNWITYVSAETGRQEVWLEPLPVSGQRYQLTVTGGRHPLWSPDGGTIYYDDEAGQMFAIEVSVVDGQPRFGAATALPIKGFVQGDNRRQFDIMPDGKGFVMLFAPGGS